MTPVDVRARIPLGDAELVPPPELFLHPSRLHGQAHVARVRPGDYLRNPEAKGMVGFAADLFNRSSGWQPADDFFGRLWKVAVQIESHAMSVAQG